MKKLLLLSLILFCALSCKKKEYSPEGPTDVRVKNLSDVTFTEVIVNTSGGIETLGDINPGEFSGYSLFDKAFPKAEITVKIDGELFSTGEVNYYGMTYIGQAKITYEVFISNLTARSLEISNCSLDAPLD